MRAIIYGFPKVTYSFHPALSDFRFRVLCLHGRDHGRTPFALLALLLLALPLVFTLQKLVALETLGEDSHQLHADSVCNLCISLEVRLDPRLHKIIFSHRISNPLFKIFQRKDLGCNSQYFEIVLQFYLCRSLITSSCIS